MKLPRLALCSVLFLSYVFSHAAAQGGLAGRIGRGGTTRGTGNNPGGGLAGAADAATNAANTLTGAAGRLNLPSGGSGSASGSSVTSNNNQSNSVESNTLLTVIDKAFNTETDSIDPGNGTMKWHGHSYSLDDVRMFRSRFERYLSLPPSTDQQEYQRLVDQIFNLLSTRTATNVDENMRQAWILLYQTSEFDADGGNSLGLANRVFDTWRIRDENEAQRIAGLELDRLKQQQQGTVAYNSDVMGREAGRTALDGLSQAALMNPISLSLDNSSTTTNPDPNGGTTIGGGGNTGGTNRGGGTTGGANRRGGSSGSTPSGPAPGGSTVGVGTSVLNASRLVETQAKIVALKTSQALTVTTAKLQFQTQIISLFLQRRFQHALIASSFYRFIFKGSQQQLDPALKKSISDFMPSAGDIPFTIETIETWSREAINEVKHGMASVRSNFDETNLMSSLERLEETFFLGEFLSDVTQFEKDKRAKLYTLFKKVDAARKLSDLKDYDALVKLTDEIGTMTHDFRSAEVIAYVRAAQRMSSLALSGAQQAAAMGDFDKAQDGVAKAASIWPLNPDIEKYSNNLRTATDLGSQANILFDDAFKSGDLRRIYDHRAELAVALMNDGQRGPQFKQIIDKMSRIEIALAQSQELTAQNNAFGAFEALKSAATLSPNDVLVNQRIAELAPRVAEFVGKLDLAKRSEDSGNIAASLTYYLAVQDLYAGSQMARQGIDRVASRLLAQLSTDTTVAPSENASTTAGKSASDDASTPK